MLSRRFLPIVVVAALALLATACGGRAWRSTVSEDSAAAYSRYLREHPDSKHAAEARARLAFVRVRSKPTRQAFSAFRESFPESPLVAELGPFVEEAFFREARAGGTAASNRRFLADFPSGPYAGRALGNAEYLESSGFGGDVDQLATFAKRHPESDYAAEAERSVATVGLRGRTGFDQVALLVDVTADTPGADRLRRLFIEKAVESYRVSRVDLVVMNGPTDPRLSHYEARLTIKHREAPVQTQLEAGTVSQPGILAQTEVVLAERQVEEPIWSDVFTFRVPVAEVRAGESVLFHPQAWTTYWKDRFFAPVATWNTRVTTREPRTLEKPAVAVEVLGSRAVVLYGDGDFQMLDLSDPASPVVLGEYRRERDLAHFDGVVGLQGGMGIYGPDGIEIVSFSDAGASRGQKYPRNTVGSIVGLVDLGGALVSGGNRGLLWLRGDGTVVNLFPREVLGLARYGSRLVFTDGTSLYLASIDVLQRGRVESELRLGRGFRPATVRLNGNAAIVIGDPGLVWVNVADPLQPRIVSRLDRSQVGDFHDATVVGGRIFLIGPRGLQVSNPGGERVADSVDVIPRHRIEAAGRHVVLIGEKSLQVVDATPFAMAPTAAPAR